MATVTVAREIHSVRNKLGSYKVFVDDTQVAKLGWFRPEATFDIQPGKHTIYVRLDRWKKSNTLEFESAENDEPKFSFRNVMNPAETVHDLVEKTGYNETKGRNIVILTQVQ